MDNVETVISIYRAVAEGKPLTSRVVTITGQAITDPKNFLAPIGMNFNELIEAAGGYKSEPEKLISGKDDGICYVQHRLSCNKDLFRTACFHGG